MTDTELEAFVTGAKSAYSDFELPTGYHEHVAILFKEEKETPLPAEHWGNLASDDFTILRNGDSITWIELRLDVRKLDDALLGGVLLLAKTWDCTLVEVDHRMVCEFNVTELRRMLAGHAASRAIKDPATWLPYLADRCAHPSDSSSD